MMKNIFKLFFCGQVFGFFCHAEVFDVPHLVNMTPYVREDIVHERCRKQYDNAKLREEFRKLKPTDPTYQIKDKEIGQISSAINDCVSKEILKLIITVDVFLEPKKDSKKLGIVQITFPDGSPTYHYIASTPLAKPMPFVPDVYDSDWGYQGTYQTALAQEGEWVMLPKNPFPTPVWINWSKTEGQSLKAIDIFKLDLIEFNTNNLKGSFIFEKYEDGKFTAHEETAADMDCEGALTKEQKEEMILKAPKKTMLKKDLFDADGHFTGRVKYTRGC